MGSGRVSLAGSVPPSPSSSREKGSPGLTLPLQPREKVSSIDLEINSLSSLLDDMTKNDPFKARVRAETGAQTSSPETLEYA